MHPTYQSDRPGNAPCCGMRLTPVYAGEASQETASAVARGAQVAGVATARVSRSSATHVIRVLGRIAPDETRVHRITALADGVVRAVSSFTVGSVVEHNAFLASYYVAAPEIFSAIQSYFVAMNAMEQRLDVADNPAVVDQAKAQIRVSQELLKTYGLSEPQLREMARTRQATRDIEFRSPVSGLVLLRNVGLGQRAAKGDELFRIADLSEVWVLADVFEADAAHVRPGMIARVTYRGQTYRAKVRPELPPFDAGSRTLKTRLEVNNPAFQLRPDMFVDVEFDVTEPDAIRVPADAVLDSGLRKSVFVKVSDGVFEPRDIQARPRAGSTVEITSGLKEGDEIVVSGMFLLDSETRLHALATAPETPSAKPGTVDPVCHMPVDATKSEHRAQHGGKTYHFCSSSCKEQFESDPARFAAGQGGSS